MILVEFISSNGREISVDKNKVTCVIINPAHGCPGYSMYIYLDTMEEPISCWFERIEKAYYFINNDPQRPLLFS